MPIATVGTPFSMRETVRGEQVKTVGFSERGRQIHTDDPPLP